MGQRANLVVVREHDYALYYCHCCANTLPRDLFWGPTYAHTFIQQQRAVSHDEWLDTIWAEGGVVFDPQTKTLLFYGGEDILFNVPLRRVYLTLLQHVWANWTISWAHHGIVDLADYVGIPSATVIARKEPVRRATTLREPTQRAWVDVVGSVRFADSSLWFFPLTGNVSFYLANGPELLTFAERDRALQSLDLREWTTEFPRGGFHIDVAAQTLTVWQADDFILAEDVPGTWSDWSIQHINDRFEGQLTLTDGRLQMPTIDPDHVIAQLTTMLLHEADHNPVDGLRTIVEQEQQTGMDVSVNPYAWRHDPQRLPRTIKERILNDAIQAWRQQSNTSSDG